ncbi:MAG: DUF4115 domain-containing protein [Acidiferrobacterales bacterium]|nr:DUF4115 domain-containing protein [Acidiferrobacterales bacterium]
MEEKELPVNSISELPVQGSGSILAIERKTQNKSIEEIANELNLTITQVRTIELDQTDGLPEPTYVRGYIRSYANLLDLDPDQVLKNYLNPNWQKSSKLDEIPRGIGSADEYTGRRGSKLRWFLMLLLLAGAGAGIWFSGLLDNVTNPNSNDELVAASITTGAQPSTSNDQLADQLTEDVDLSNTVATEQFDELESLEAVTDTQPESISNTEPEPIAVSSVNELVLNFTQTSWIDIRDSEDTRLAYKSFVAGEELVVTSEGPLSVFIGNAEGVTVQHKGRNFDISQYREGVYAKFVVENE